MSDFKFACPVCGQHITADSKASGTQLDCPTCFQKIIVPQAPAVGESKFILAAAMVSKPRPGISVSPELSPLRRAKPSSSFYFVALCLLVICATTTAFLRWHGEILINALNKDELVIEPNPVYPVPTNTSWTMDLPQAIVPEGTVAGRVHGNGFLCERAILRGGLLSLRQGKIWPPDLGISVLFFAQQGEELSGKTIVVRPDRPPPLPQVVVRWKDEQNQPATEYIDSGYALKLTFGQAANGRMPGRIFISLPDGPKTFAAGSFDAVIRKPLPPKPQTTSAKPRG